MPLSDTDARVVLMCGVSGSGKTFRSRELERNGFVRLSPDEIAWRRHGPGFLSLPFEQQKPIFAESFATLLAETGRLLDEGRKVVVDSTMCKRQKRDLMREVCRRHGVEPLLVWLDVPADRLRRRLADRRDTGPDDIRVSDRRLAQFLAGFEPPTPDEHPLTLHM